MAALETLVSGTGPTATTFAVFVGSPLDKSDSDGDSDSGRGKDGMATGGTDTRIEPVTVRDGGGGTRTERASIGAETLPPFCSTRLETSSGSGGTAVPWALGACGCACPKILESSDTTVGSSSSKSDFVAARVPECSRNEESVVGALATGDGGIDASNAAGPVGAGAIPMSVALRTTLWAP
jgi:hypothetical protein